jgi:pullulanase-type alpha-1,6-glucosidase
MRVSPTKISRGEQISLHYDPAGPDESVRQKFPHLAQAMAFRLSPEDLDKVPEILKGQMIVSARSDLGRLLDTAGLQIPGVLDDLYSYSGPLGITYEDYLPVLRLWAPTARSVRLLLYAEPRTNPPQQSIPMQFNPTNGVWTASGDSNWNEKYYLYEVRVYVPATKRIETNLVTDPYSISLSMNSIRSQIVDLASPDLQPPGWKDHPKPPLDAPEDIVIYELHVRDFSIYDSSVPPEQRGKFIAFTNQESIGLTHLRQLAMAGLTHIHLMPAFDFATVNEDPTQRRDPDPARLATFPGNSPRQAEIINEYQNIDGFNWGYDPFHYSVPEGSYATDPDGPARIIEFRQMVQSLHENGLRVVMDVVYNHTHTNGQAAQSVLDRIVPGYYHRLNIYGEVENSTCCSNTASEHQMMEKLMIDSLLIWAREYQMDGFRFDLMGHHMCRNLVHARQALDQLTLEEDGIDGHEIFLYGEGWDFGEVANNIRGQNASQINMAGTGIGVFNDRLRDGARGGGSWGGLQNQGFLTGLYTDPNWTDQGWENDQKYRLYHYEDWIRIGMAGNLKDFLVEVPGGQILRGDQIDYGGRPAGYCADPQENVVYISAHDNETLFDAIQLKASPSDGIAERVRMQNLGNALVLLSQGVPFFLAGDELLRSKSLDRNSYNSGDWFNHIDFSGQTNNWAIGLPPGESRVFWPLFKPILSDSALKPTPADAQLTFEVFKEFLRIRKSSPLFRLRTAVEIRDRLKFHNTGPGRLPGLIVMSISDQGSDILDPQTQLIVVFLNAYPTPKTYQDIEFQNLALALHPIQQNSVDPIIRTASFDPARGSFLIPGRTASVFVLVR